MKSFVFSTETLYSPESDLRAGSKVKMVVELGGDAFAVWMSAPESVVNGSLSFHQVTVVLDMNRL